MSAMVIFARDLVEQNLSGLQMAYQRSIEMQVSVKTDTLTEMLCGGNGRRRAAESCVAARAEPGTGEGEVTRSAFRALILAENEWSTGLLRGPAFRVAVHSDNGRPIHFVRLAAHLGRPSRLIGIRTNSGAAEKVLERAAPSWAGDDDDGSSSSSSSDGNGNSNYSDNKQRLESAQTLEPECGSISIDLHSSLRHLNAAGGRRTGRPSRFSILDSQFGHFGAIMTPLARAAFQTRPARARPRRQPSRSGEQDRRLGPALEL